MNLPWGILVSFEASTPEFLLCTGVPYVFRYLIRRLLWPEGFAGLPTVDLFIHMLLVALLTSFVGAILWASWETCVLTVSKTDGA